METRRQDRHPAGVCALHWYKSYLYTATSYHTRLDPLHTQYGAALPRR